VQFRYCGEGGGGGGGGGRWEELGRGNKWVYVLLGHTAGIAGETEGVNSTMIKVARPVTVE
jgi:hypothetical protein